MVDLTVVILTKNEENNLKKCIESFKGIVKRFVIVDSYSTDNTKKLCDELKKSVNLDFYENKFIDYATQLNWGLKNTNINTTWSMRMDADEEVTEELVKEIKAKLPNITKDINGIILKRRVYFMGKWIKHGGKYPELLLRIFRTGYGMCEQKLMDEHMILSEGNTEKFDNDIIDNNNKNLDWWTHKHNWYSNREVLDYQNKVKSNYSDDLINDEVNKGQASRKRFIKNNGYYKLPMFFRAHLYFIYRYYIRLGFLDGTEGKIYHFLQAYWYRFLVDAKIYECEKFNIEMKGQGDLK
ncbi:glycosyltransferase family 2 protein [Clostridium perfringens]|uniref:glycosyltransferase family 2 protein n=1 Tax=Clostridium perfringens TaxID=1502 RepID=UPI001A1D45E2|nr:glycosyltransferase family 2 protein [Clostridium perfringens]MDM0455044.1 glycosyltransferase family 2 protein [Clostridium perfringens]MDM0986312.1 glycosyltransferase family 2 protein [Clostridium perfringens]UYC93414.1 glycosyltransferase family 2 protein [Clostridium perfringens]HAT4204378.1 glycosyltransferase family 2 protein [Clostridium perfringens]